MRENQTAQDHKTIFKEWLEKLQQESWQLELLISGFAIFGIYSARTLITDFYFFRENEYFGEIGVIIGLVGYIFKTGWLIFFLNLIIHVILRGLWIGAIGLRYVSQEIDYDSLGYSEIFTSFLKKKVGTYDDFIERLEKICSVLFAFTFLLFLLFTSLMIFILQTFLFVLIGTKLDPGNAYLMGMLSLVATFYFLLGCLVCIDLVTLGGFKKIKEKHISGLYFYLYRYFSFVTFSFLYRPLLYNFIDNNYTRKLFYLSIPYIFIVGGGYTMFENNPNPYQPDKNDLLSNGLMLEDYYYDDLRNILLQEYPNEERKINKQRLEWISLEKFYITEPTSSFFIKLDNNIVELLALDTTLVPYKKKGYAFRWFNANKIENKQLAEMEKAKSKELSDLYELKRAMNKEFKKQKNTNLKKQIDSISEIIDTKNDIWEIKLMQKRKQNVDEILNAYISQIKFYIDSLQVPLKHCYFYKHPHFKEQGLKCFFNTDSIPKGIHHTKFVRNIFSRTDTITKDSVILPILKH